jgi:EpsG family
MKDDEKKFTVHVAMFIGALVFLRLMVARPESFSYDFINYLTYFRLMRDAEWASIFELFPSTMPYVGIPGGGLFEIGFVLLAKVVLIIFSPDATYALLASLSVIFRTILMRGFQLEWKWIIPTQVYAITLFEANALRAGLALTLTLWVLMLIRRGKFLGALGAGLLAMSQHVQVLLFLIPFALAKITPCTLLRLRWFGFVVFTFLCLGVSMVDKLIGGIGYVKLDDYMNQVSAAVGVNMTSMVSLVFICMALVFISKESLDGNPGLQDVDKNVWIFSLYAALPSIALFIFGVKFSALSDRAWQFALIIIITQSKSMVEGFAGLLVRENILFILLPMLLLNTLIRYPLSNFFFPFLPYNKIMPLVIVGD